MKNNCMDSVFIGSQSDIFFFLWKHLMENVYVISFTTFGDIATQLRQVRQSEYVSASDSV